jgi:hypothetical protein
MSRSQLAPGARFKSVVGQRLVGAMAKATPLITMLLMNSGAPPTLLTTTRRGGVVPLMDCVPKSKAKGAKLRAGAAAGKPLPVKAKLASPLLALERTDSEALRAPTAVG